MTPHDTRGAVERLAAWHRQCADLDRQCDHEAGARSHEESIDMLLRLLDRAESAERDKEMWRHQCHKTEALVQKLCEDRVALMEKCDAADATGYARGVRAAADVAAKFDMANHIAHDMRTGKFPAMSEKREAIATAILALLPTVKQPDLCDCERGHNGIGLAARICDCQETNDDH